MRICNWKRLMLFISRFLQKQPPEVFYKNSSPEKFRNISRKTPVSESLFNKVAGHKVAGLKVCNFLKKRLQQRCFRVNIAKFLRTLILKNISKRFFLKLKERNIKGILHMISFHFSFCNFMTLKWTIE